MSALFFILFIIKINYDLYLLIFFLFFIPWFFFQVFFFYDFFSDFFRLPNRLVLNTVFQIILPRIIKPCLVHEEFAFFHRTVSYQAPLKKLGFSCFVERSTRLSSNRQLKMCCLVLYLCMINTLMAVHQR